jgi:TldD protein
MRIDAETRRIDPRVKQVMASLGGGARGRLIASSDGTLTADVRPLVRVNVSVIVEQNGRREQGYSGGGGRFGLDELLRGDEPFDAWPRGGAPGAGQSRGGAGAGRRDDRRAGPGLAGHPAARGHRPRARRRLQPQGHLGLLGRIGQKVAADEITVVDDGTLDRRRGSLNVDDEGTPTKCTVLIEDGVLRGYMQDKP